MATLTGWMQVGLRRERDAARTDARQLAARLAADGELKTALTARAARLERELEAARGEVGAQTDAVRATAEAGAALERDLADARVHVDVLTRALRRRATGGLRVVPPPDGASGSVAEALIASPGTQLVALEPAPPFHDVRGHVLWHPAQDELILYAFDLPPLPDGAGYRIRLTFEGERVEERLAFRAPASGRMVQPVALAGASARLRVVEVVLEPAGRAVLAGRTRPSEP
jgi:hypothetical protein